MDCVKGATGARLVGGITLALNGEGNTSWFRDRITRDSFAHSYSVNQTFGSQPSTLLSQPPIKKQNND